MRVTRAAELPAGVRDLADGNPDPRLLPPLAEALARVEPAHRALRRRRRSCPELAALARRSSPPTASRGDVAITGGALDAIERALQTELQARRPRRRRGPDLAADRRPRARARASRSSPSRSTGADSSPTALDARATPRGAGRHRHAARPEPDRRRGRPRPRGRELRAVLARHPDALVIEDDYVAQVAGAPYVAAPQRRRGAGPSCARSRRCSAPTCASR